MRIERTTDDQDNPAGVELSSPLHHLAGLHPLDARAYELERVDELVGESVRGISFRRKADRVRGCTPLDGEGWRTCKQRECPACAFRLSEHRVWEFAGAIRRMRNPVLILVTYRSRSLDDLADTLADFRLMVTTLLRKRVRGLRGALGVIEPKLSADRHFWAVHGHVVLDVDAVRWMQARADWHHLTDGRGRLSEDARPVHRRSPFALARYLAKGTDACPPPGTMRLSLLARLWPALYRRQLVLMRGPDVRRGRAKHRR